MQSETAENKSSSGFDFFDKHIWLMIEGGGGI